MPTQSSEHALIQQEQPTQSSGYCEVTVSPSTNHQTHHSSLPTMTVKPPGVLLAITQEPTAEVSPPPVHHEATAKPVPEKDVGTSTTQYANPTVTPEPTEGVELLSNQQKAPVQCLERVQSEKPSLGQQEGTVENSELLEEVEPSSAQQESQLQPLEHPHESAHHEATDSDLVHSHVHPPASHNVTAKPPGLNLQNTSRKKLQLSIQFPLKIINILQFTQGS